MNADPRYFENWFAESDFVSTIELAFMEQQ
jgi:hypothetical protein